jgi:uroporphyrinogen-III synthase
MLLITRPGDEGVVLAARLRESGVDALWWPAFDIRGEADAAALRALADLPGFDLAVFVSPEAVRATARALPRGTAWPAGTRIATAGAATRAAAREAFGEAAEVLSPGGMAGDGGSEALWKVLQEARASGAPEFRRAVLFRAGQGREWLGERLREGGAEVVNAAVYRREAHEPGPPAIAALRSALASGARPAILYSSSEAVAVVLGQLRKAAAEVPWPGESAALCLHPRIDAAARAAGHADVRNCGADAASVLAALGARGGASALGV